MCEHHPSMALTCITMPQVIIPTAYEQPALSIMLYVVEVADRQQKLLCMLELESSLLLVSFTVTLQQPFILALSCMSIFMKCIMASAWLVQLNKQASTRTRCKCSSVSVQLTLAWSNDVSHTINFDFFFS